MARLICIHRGSDDVAVGISGFGSVRAPPERWLPLARWTGRTTFVLQYDAQELPWSTEHEAGLEEATSRVIPSIDVLVELVHRWKDAFRASEEASDHLAHWIERWTSSRRRVLIAGFSLGARVGWNAVDRAPDGKVEAMLLLGALGNCPGTWVSLPKVGRVTNAWSSRDQVLSWLYPRGVPASESVAVGVAPVLTGGAAHVLNVDVSDLVRGHGEASSRLSWLLDHVLSVQVGTWGGSTLLDRTEVNRLCALAHPTVRDFVTILDPVFASKAPDFDFDRLVLFARDEEALERSARAALSLYDAILGSCPEVARRSLWALRGSFRQFASQACPELAREHPGLFPVVPTS